MKLPPALLLALFCIDASSFAQTNDITSTVTDNRAVNITVYNSGRGLVTVKREVELPDGQVGLKFMDVAAKIMPETVAIKALDGKPLSVLEQNYEFDLLSPKKLLDKYVGKAVTMISSRMKDNSVVDEEKTGTLLATNDGTVWKIDDRIVVNPAYSRLVFPEIPLNFIPKPTLVWLLQNGSKGRRSIEASYLTQGISWKSDYVLTLEADGVKAGLQGWVTIKNESGTGYENATVQLIAGDLNEVPDPREHLMQRQTAYMADAAAEPQFKEKQFFEYHLYTLDRQTTVRDNQQKQVSLLSADGITVSREYRLDGQEWYFIQRMVPQKSNIAVKLKFKNTKANQLGMPLPKGTVRLYQRDTDGSSQFVGEDAIEHTPKDEEIDLDVGKAFDVVSERKQTDFQVIRNDEHESEFEVKIRNHKDVDVTVLVREPLRGDWEIKKSSHEYTKNSAFGVDFPVLVKKDGEAVLTYRVRTRF